jgi:hypothetical protein
MPSRKLYSGSFYPTGALFAAATSSCFDGAPPSRELPKRKSGLLHDAQFRAGNRKRAASGDAALFHFDLDCRLVAVVAPLAAEAAAATSTATEAPVFLGARFVDVQCSAV